MASLAGSPLERRVADLEVRLAKLEKLLPLASDGSLTIAAPKITLNSPIVEVKAANSLTLSSGNAMTLKSALSVDVKSGSVLSLEGGSTASMKAGSALSLDGSMLVLNKGSRPLARAGDAITTSGAPAGMAGVIVPNASTVLG